MALKGTANSNGEGFELLEADNYDGRLVAIIELGMHEESYKGGPAKMTRKVLFVWELAGVTRADGKPWYVNRRYTLSFHEKASMRKDLERHRRKPYKEGEEIDPMVFLGQPWDIKITNSEKGEKKYFAVGDVGPVAKARAASVPEPTVEPFAYEIGGDPEALNAALSWLPFVYGDKVEDLVKTGRRNMALAGTPAGAGNTPDNSDDDQDIPF